MDENIRQMTESDKYMESFLNNLKDKHAGIGNIYVARTVDKNGKTVDVKFGKNMMTDYGMQQFFITKNNFPNKLYIGYGSTSTGFNHTSQQLVEPYDTVSTLVSETRDYAYPMYFDKVSGLVTCVCRALQVKFPLNISGLPDEISITEYGIGTAWNALWTHSWVYDTLGRYGTLIKRPEQELYIDVYYCMSYYEDLILDNWANGRYTVITTLSRFFNRMTGAIYTYRRGNITVSRASNTSNTAFQNNQITNYRNINNFTMQNVFDPADSDAARNANKANGYIDGFIDWHSGFMEIERELLTTPEPISSEIAPYHHEVNCFSSNFGKNAKDGVPFTQADIVSVKLYNYNTHAWDINSEFENDSNKWYTETSLETSVACPIYYTNNNIIVGMYVYQNLNTNDPISSFDLNLETVYAAEKYWDNTTWHHISNLAQVSNNDTNEHGHTMNCQTARYYVTNSNAISLVPHRSNDGFIIKTNDETITPVGFTAHYNTQMYSTSDPVNEWFLESNYLYSVKYNKLYHLPTIINTGSFDQSDMQAFWYNNTMVMIKWNGFGNNNTLAVFYGLKDLSTQPSGLIERLSFDGNNNISNFYSGFGAFSETKTGYVAVQGNGYSTSWVYNLKGDTYSKQSYSTRLMCCVWGVDRIAYVEAADTTKIKVYEFGNTNDVIQTFDIPSGFTVNYMFGHTNYLWLVSSSSSVATICCDIISGTMTNCNIAMGELINTHHYNHIEACDEAIILWKRDRRNVGSHYWIKLSDPTVIHTFADIASTLGETNTDPWWWKISKLSNGAMALLADRRVNSNNRGAVCRVIDFANYLDGHTGYVVTEDQYGTNDGCYFPSLIPYGDYYITYSPTGLMYIPIEYWMKHKLIGTTPTITSLNNFINVRNKQFWTTFTNITDYQGLPPGDKQ